MPISVININSHKVHYGQTSRQHEQVKQHIYQIINEHLAPRIQLDSIDVYNMDGRRTNYRAGTDRRAIIFFNQTQESATGEEKEVEIIVKDVKKTVKLLPPLGTGILITSENGVVIAEYNKEHNELNVLFDLFGNYEDSALVLFEHILNQWYELYWKVIELQHSWIHTQDKNGLTKRFTERLQQQNQQILQEDKRKASNYEQTIEDYKMRIKSTYDNMIRLRNKIEVDEKNLNNIGTQLIDQLDLIVAHPKISDLHIKNGKFILFVPDVYCYDDNGKRYYIGNFRIEIKLENTQVKFFGDNPRRSYWTRQDPHPHVNGESGSACLGNVASTIAELCARNEIYALALVCIDFLESANTSDPAGRNVANWQQVDEEGNAIGGNHSTWVCDHCSEEYNDDHQQNIAYAYIDDEGDPSDERTVCNDCLQDHYHFDDDTEEYIED